MKLRYEDYKKIQAMKKAGYNGSQVTKKLGYSQYGVYKVWDMTDDEFLRDKKIMESEFDKYKEFAIEKIKLFPKISNRALIDKIREEFDEEADINYQNFNRYMRGVRVREGFTPADNRRKFRIATQRPPGQLAQVDLGQKIMKTAEGKLIKVYFFGMVLTYSRMKFIYFSPVPFDATRFIYAHDKAFRYFAGRPREIMYDQDRVQVVSENAGQVIFVKEFEKYKQKIGLDIYLCKGSDPDTKGMAENLIRYTKMNFLSNRFYEGVDALNVAAIKWLDRTANFAPHGTTKRSPRRMFEDEQKYLIDYEPQNIDLVKRRPVVVNCVNGIVYKNNRYSIPLDKYGPGDKLMLTQDNETLTITDIQTGEIVIIHTIDNGVGMTKTLPVQKNKPKIYREMMRIVGDTDISKKFIEKVAEQYPRYITEQMRLLKRLLDTFDKLDIIDAMGVATDKNEYSINEVALQVLSGSSFKEADKILPIRSTPYYKEKVSLLDKYSKFVEGEDNE